jgi:hypothetical protein
MQSSSKDRFLPKYDVWKENLVLQLLWMHQGLADETHFSDGNLPDLPSWSWAATCNLKGWAETGKILDYEDFVRARQMPEEMIIDSAGTIKVVGDLSEQPASSGATYQSNGGKIAIIDSMMDRYFNPEDTKSSTHISVLRHNTRLHISSTASSKEFWVLLIWTVTGRDFVYTFPPCYR